MPRSLCVEFRRLRLRHQGPRPNSIRVPEPLWANLVGSRAIVGPHTGGRRHRQPPSTCCCRSPQSLHLVELGARSEGEFIALHPKTNVPGFSWQDGYAAVSETPSEVETVKRYIAHQNDFEVRDKRAVVHHPVAPAIKEELIVVKVREIAMVNAHFPAVASHINRTVVGVGGVRNAAHEGKAGDARQAAGVCGHVDDGIARIDFIGNECPIGAGPLQGDVLGTGQGGEPVAAPAGTTTVSPFVAELTAAETSARVGLLAVITAASVGTKAPRNKANKSSDK